MLLFKRKKIEPFVFKSTCQIRYEHGRKLDQECFQGRTISVEENINGCKGYKLARGKGYIVRITNDVLNVPTMSAKPMLVIDNSSDKIELRGYPVKAQGPFGWVDVDYRDYGLTVYYQNNRVEKCVLHMFDRNVDIEYMAYDEEQVEDKTITKEMDTFDLKPYRIGDFNFKSLNFTEYENGELKDRGSLPVTVIVKNEINKYSVSVIGNGIEDKINSVFEFDGCIGCNDRLLLYSLPEKTNANIIVMTVLRNLCSFTRNKKIYSATEPVVCSIFTNNGHPVKVSFTFANPERVLEFY